MIRRRRFDVTFYTPFVGDMLSPGKGPPPGGAETQIVMLARALSRRGLKVAIVAFGKPGQLPAAIDGVTIIGRSRGRPNKPLVLKLLEIAKIWRSLSRAPSIAVVYRCSGPELGLIGAYTRFARRRLVFSTANVVDFQLESLVSKRRDLLLYRLGVRLADDIVVQTDEQVTMCKARFGRTPALIKSLAEVAPVPAARQAEAFLWVGRLVSYKRPLDYVALARAVPEAQFWMVGVPAAGEHALLSTQVAEQSEQLPNLQLLAPRPHAELSELMARAVASVNTAEFEGMPNVLLEAWAHGVPALVLRHDPNGVIAEHGLGSFAAGSTSRLAECAREMWATRGDRTELSKRCREYLRRNHDPDLAAARWQAVLEGTPPPAERQSPAAAETRCAA